MKSTYTFKPRWLVSVMQAAVAVAVLILGLIIAHGFGTTGPQPQLNSQSQAVVPGAVSTANVELPAPVGTINAVATANTSHAATVVAQTTNAVVKSAPQIAVTPESFETLLAAHDYGAWGYTVTRNSAGSLGAHINYDYNTVSGLKAYATANKQLAQQLPALSSAMQIDITFKTYKSVDSFRQWASAYGLNVKQAYLRYTDTPQNSAGTMFVAGTIDDALPAATLNDEVSSLTKSDDNIVVKGVYYVHASVSGAKLKDIAADPDVFIPDVTANAVRSDLLALAIPEANSLNIEAQPSFGYMEDLGLDAFK